MVGSLSSGSSGPSPVISSRISETKSSSSCVLSARRSTSTYCETSCWTCRRISSSGQLLQRRKIDLLDQPPMQAHLGVEQLVAEQRTCRLRGGSIRFSRRAQERLSRTRLRARRRFVRRRRRRFRSCGATSGETADHVSRSPSEASSFFRQRHGLSRRPAALAAAGSAAPAS